MMNCLRGSSYPVKRGLAAHLPADAELLTAAQRAPVINHTNIPRGLIERIGRLVRVNVLGVEEHVVDVALERAGEIAIRFSMLGEDFLDAFGPVLYARFVAGDSGVALRCLRRRQCLERLVGFVSFAHEVRNCFTEPAIGAVVEHGGGRCWSGGRNCRCVGGFDLEMLMFW